jgi:hypothetical protein
MEDGVSNYADLQSPPTDNIQNAKPYANLTPADGLKTSTIDMALSPELLDHIKRTATRENSIWGKGSGNFNQPNTIINTEANKSGP